MTAPILSARDIVVRYGPVAAVDRASLEVQDGQIVSLIGPNGAGKTSMFNAIAGVRRPQEGTVSLDGAPIDRLPAYRRARLGMGRTFQGGRLFGRLTLRENLELAHYHQGRSGLLSSVLGGRRARSDRDSDRRLADEALTSMELESFADTTCSALPCGVQRLGEVARALCLEPRILLLDEPSAGLDPAETARLAKFVRQIRAQRGVSVLLIEHDMNFVMNLSDYLYVLDFGVPLAEGAPAQIRSDPAVVAAYLGEENVAEPLLAVEGLTVDYDRARAVHGVDLHVGAGEVVALLGANGAGKSSILLAISGLVSAGGRARFDGADILGRRPDRIARLGLVQIPEERAIFPQLTVEETLTVAAYTRRKDSSLAEDRAWVDEILPRLGRLRRQQAGSLSGGEQQMLVIAKALLARPRLLLVDELSLGLSPKVTADLLGVLEQIRARGTAILLVEQFVGLALRLADRAYVLQKGRVVTDGTADELIPEAGRLAASYLGGALPDIVTA